LDVDCDEVTVPTEFVDLEDVRPIEFGKSKGKGGNEEIDDDELEEESTMNGSFITLSVLPYTLTHKFQKQSKKFIS
jgi:hypothetical protein